MHIHDFNAREEAHAKTRRRKGEKEEEGEERRR